MSIAILRRRLRDRARVRRRPTRSWLLRRKQRSASIHFLKNCTLKTRTSSEIILEWTKQQFNQFFYDFICPYFFLTHLADFPFPPFYYHVFLFCKHHFIIPKQYSDWLISIKVWRKLGWSSIPSKLVKVLNQRFLWPLSLPKFHPKNFGKENFDSDNGPSERDYIAVPSVPVLSWGEIVGILFLSTCGLHMYMFLLWSFVS